MCSAVNSVNKLPRWPSFWRLNDGPGTRNAPVRGVRRAWPSVAGDHTAVGSRRLGAGGGPARSGRSPGGSGSDALAGPRSDPVRADAGLSTRYWMTELTSLTPIRLAAFGAFW